MLPIKAFVVGIAGITCAVLSLVAHARCQEGATWEDEQPDGTVCIHECVSGRWQVECSAPPEKSSPGTITPRYYILSVVYCPPGAAGGSSTAVEYGVGSSMGSTLSVNKSFADSYAVTVSAGFDGVIYSAELAASYKFSRSASNSSAMELTKSANFTMSVPGPSADGVDHDRDQIWLWLNPSLSASATSSKLQWTIDSTKPAALQYVYVGWLKDPTKMPAGVKQALTASGITEAEYPRILRSNPYASGNPTVDSARYFPTNYFLPYIPPYAAGDPATTVKYEISSENVQKTGQESIVSHTLGVTASGGAKFLEIWNAKLEVAGEWEWSTTTASEASITNSQNASVTLGGPSYGYQGPTLMAVYYDSQYRTFLFVPTAVAPRQGIRGKLNSAIASRRLSGLRVVMQLGGRTYTTFTDSRGEYVLPVSFGSGAIAKMRIANGPTTTVTLRSGLPVDLRIR